MAEKLLMTLLLPDSYDEKITILIMSSEEFDAICDELQVIAEAHKSSWTGWEALKSECRRRNINQLVRCPWTEAFFVKHGVETTYLAAYDNEHSLARNAIIAARDSAKRYDAYLEIIE